MALFLLLCIPHPPPHPSLSATALIQRAAPPGSITIAHGLTEDPHSDKESTCQRKRHTGEGLIPASGRSPEGRHGNPLQYSCPKSPRGQRSLASCSPWGSKEPNVTEWPSMYARARTHTHTLAPALGCIASPVPWRELPVAKIKVSFCGTQFSPFLGLP